MPFSNTLAGLNRIRSCYRKTVAVLKTELLLRFPNRYVEPVQCTCEELSQEFLGSILISKVVLCACVVCCYYQKLLLICRSTARLSVK